MNIRISGLGGQGAVTAAHLLAMAANRDGKFSISNPFFGAEKRMAPAESYCRIGSERIYDRGVCRAPLKSSATANAPGKPIHLMPAANAALMLVAVSSMATHSCAWRFRSANAFW